VETEVEALARKALREEVAWRRGIRWFLGWGSRDERYWTKGKIQFAEETPDGDILVTAEDGWILKISRDYKIEWRRLEGIVGKDWCNAATWNSKTGRVLVSDPANRRVLVYNPEEDEIELTLDRWTGAEPFGKVRAEWEGHFPPISDETGRIIVADLDNHVVGIFDEVGKLLYRFGTYGAAGKGSLLNQPTWASGHSNYCRIADYFNHRAIIVDLETGTFKLGACYPYPTYFCFNWPNWFLLTSEYFRPAVWSADGMIAIPWWISEACLTMTKEATFLGTNHGNVIEWDLRTAPLYSVPAIFPNIIGTSLEAGKSSGIYPLVCLGWSKVQVQAFSTQDATLNIYSLRSRGGLSESPIEAGLDASGNLQWQLYDYVPIPANKLTSYLLEGAVGVMGVEAVMGATAGSYDLKAIFNP